MNKIIPFYGKPGSIRSIRQIGEFTFDVETYNKDGSSSMTNSITISKEFMLKNYLKDIKGCLEEYATDYEEAKYMTDNKIITKRNIQYLIVGIIGLIGIPILTKFLVAQFFGLITVLNTAIMISSIKQSLNELINKTFINDMNELIEEYESLQEEEKNTEKELKIIHHKETTKFSKIKPRVMEQNKDKDKKKVK